VGRRTGGGIIHGVARRRVILFVVSLVVLAAIVSAIAPRGNDATDTAPVVPGEGPAAPAAPVVDASMPRKAPVAARVGDVVQLRVANDAADVVQIPALGLEEPVEEGLDATLVFDADRAGRFPVVLRESGRRIGTLAVKDAH
jgi:hypothetical protein